MPPASFVGAVTGACINLELLARFVLPSATREGDTIVAMVGAPIPPANGGPDVTDTTWTLEATYATAAGKLWILRRPAEADELGNVEISFPDGFPNSGVAVLGVWRNLDTSAAAVGGSSSAVAASTNFPAPSINLAAYSDLYIGAAFVMTGEVPVTAPAGTTERAEHQADNMTLSIFDILPEAAGATGIKTATTGAAQSGLAASIALAANALVGFGKSFTVSPVGTIGLPSKGV